MNTVADFLNNSYRAHPDKIAIIDNDSKLTYSKLNQGVNEFSSFLNKFPKKSWRNKFRMYSSSNTYWNFSKKSHGPNFFSKTKTSIIFSKPFFQDIRNGIKKYRKIKIF